MGYTNSLVARWDMSTINPPDLGWRGNRYPGTGVNLVAADVVPGIAGGYALEFDGGAKHVNLGDVLELNAVSAFTIAFWMNQDIIDASDAMFSKRIDANTEIRLTTIAAGGTMRIYMSSGIATRGQFDYSTVISAGSWYHIAVVFDGSQTGDANRILLYVDGNPVNLAFVGGSIEATSPNVAGADMQIGRDANTLNGKLDEFVILSAPLTQIQVNDLMLRQRQGRL